jgi:hypothetical protein
LASAAVSDSLFSTRALDEKPPHRFGGCGKKVAAAVPVLRLFNIDKANIRFVNQGRGLKGLPRLFVAQLLHGQFAKFIVKQRQQLFRGGGIALLDLR